MTDKAAPEPEYALPIRVRRAAAQAAVAASKKTGRPVDPRVRKLAEEADRLEAMPFTSVPRGTVRQRLGRYVRNLRQVSP
jgi:hypothetical protein